MVETRVEQPTARQFARMAVCYHEAAHAVGMWAAGIDVNVLKVDVGFFTASAWGFTGVRPGQFYDYESQERMLAALISILAGRVAQERYEIEVGTPVSEARRDAAAGCESDMQDFYEISAEVSMSLNYVMVRTEIFVDQRWVQIGEVANLLFGRGRLAGRYAK